MHRRRAAADDRVGTDGGSGRRPAGVSDERAPVSPVRDEDSRPRPDSDVLLRLKVEKLRLKEEIERLRELAS